MQRRLNKANFKVIPTILKLILFLIYEIIHIHLLIGFLMQTNGQNRLQIFIYIFIKNNILAM